MKMIDKALIFADELGNVVEDCCEEIVYANYVINIGNSRDELEPVDAAYTKEEAIQIAKATQGKYKEVVYMPCNNPDINEVVWKNKKSWKEHLNIQ